MYSLNVPVPATVTRLATGLAANTVTATARRGHTLVAKRLPDQDYNRLTHRGRRALEGTPPFAARVTGVETFDDPPTGPAPVAYLAVESPGLRDLHTRLCEEFDPVAGFEGEGYTPHVTIARGGDAGDLVEADVEAFEWQVDRIGFWHPGRELEVESVSLPA